MNKVVQAFEAAVAGHANLIVLLAIAIGAAVLVDRLFKKSFMELIKGILGELGHVGHGGTLEQINIIGGMVGLLAIVACVVLAGVSDVFAHVFGVTATATDISIILLLFAVLAWIYFGGSIAICGRYRINR